MLEAKLSKDKLQVLYEASLLINSTLDLKGLLKVLMKQAETVLEAEASSVMLLDEARQELVFEVATGEAGEKLQHIRVPVGQGIAGYVARNREAVLVEDAQNDPRLYKKADKESGFVTRSMICVPVTAKEKLIGVMQVINAKEKTAFEPPDVELLQALANQAAVAIENARLYEELKQRLEEVERLRNYLSHVLKSTREAILVLDSEKRVTTWDPQAKIWFGVHEEEAVGRPLFEVLPAQLQKACRKALKLSEEEIWITDDEWSYQHNGRPLPLGVTTSPLTDDKGNKQGVIFAVRDLTETKKLVNLEEINKQKSEFISVVAHELKTPLTSIQGFASTLKESADFLQPEQKDRLLATIVREAERLNRLIEQLLNVSRIEAGKALQMNWTEVDVVSLLAHCFEIQKSYTRVHNLVDAFSRRAGIKIVADQDKLQQCVLNLLSNAVKYAPDGGDVTLTLTPDDQGITISVEDQGVGIPKDLQPKLFGRFSRIERESIKGIKGTGIGLNLVKHLVELHGGKIWVQSEEGEGSTFFIWVPKNLQMLDAG